MRAKRRRTRSASWNIHIPDHSFGRQVEALTQASLILKITDSANGEPSVAVEAARAFLAWRRRVEWSPDCWKFAGYSLPGGTD